MRVLIACEYSGIVRDAFIARGHQAVSCDLLPTEHHGPHLQRDVRDVISHSSDMWDMMIAFPPCTHLSASGAQYWKTKQADGRQQSAIEFVYQLAWCKIPRIAIENPVGILSTCFRKPDQIIQPWEFGDPVNKKTCLWLKNLPLLLPTEFVKPQFNWGSNSWRSGSRKLSPLPSLHWFGHERSKSFLGIANAMAEQWG